jgi:shikimate dehydrogenase
MTVCCAVIGNPIAHSLSPLIHQTFAKDSKIDLDYKKIKCQTATINQQVNYFFQAKGRGLNITQPFKTMAFNLATRVTSRSMVAQAANTLWWCNTELCADNTDGVGFLRDLTRYINPTGKRILLLGAGGAAQGIIDPLLKSVKTLTLANRTLIKAQLLKYQFPAINCTDFASLYYYAPFDIIINATSASLNNQAITLPVSVWQARPFCYDLTYNLVNSTPFVNNAHQQQCLAVDGLGMLIEQAAESFFIWHGIRPDVTRLLTMFNRQKIE